MANPVLWFEVLGKDGSTLRRFYRELFGWKISEGNPNNKVDYGLVQADGPGVPGGIGTSPGDSSFATFVVEVDDPAAVLAKAEQLGGKTAMPVTKVLGLNMEKAYLIDPEGHVICITRGIGGSQ